MPVEIMQHNLNAICEAVQIDQKERRRVEVDAIAAKKKQDEAHLQELGELQSAARAVAEMASHWKQKALESKRKCDAADRERLKKEGEVLFLEGKLVHAFTEVENEQRKRING